MKVSGTLDGQGHSDGAAVAAATARQLPFARPVLAAHCPSQPIVPTARSHEICFASHITIPIAASDGLHALSMSRPLTLPPTSSQPTQRADCGWLRCRHSRAQISVHALHTHRTRRFCWLLMSLQYALLCSGALSPCCCWFCCCRCWWSTWRPGRSPTQPVRRRPRPDVSPPDRDSRYVSWILCAHRQMKRGAAELTGSTDAAAAQSV